MEEERVSSSQNERTLGRGGGLLENDQGQRRGERDQNSGTFGERTF